MDQDRAEDADRDRAADADRDHAAAVLAQTDQDLQQAYRGAIPVSYVANNRNKRLKKKTDLIQEKQLLLGKFHLVYIFIKKFSFFLSISGRACDKKWFNTGEATTA